MVKKIINSIRVGEIFQNPRKGTSIIKSINDKSICYIRGNSPIYLPLDIFEDVFKTFKGKCCTTNDLKAYMPSVFSSKNGGHDCNCTFLFLIFEKLEMLNGGILRKEVSGSPFYINIKKD